MKQNQSGKRVYPGFTIRWICMSFLFIFLLVQTGKLYAQETPTLYSSILYFKIKPGKGSEFMQMMRDVNSKVQEERCKSGHWIGWFLYQVLMPAGSKSEYDYAAVSLTTKYKNLFEDPYTFDSAFHKVFAGKDEKFFTDYYSKTVELRDMVKRQIYGAIGFADSSTLQAGGPYKYLQVDFMQSKPGRESQYIKMEVDTFRVIHKERIKMNALSQWGFYGLMMPTNTSNGYNYVCVNFYDDLDMTLEGKYPEALKKVFPKVKIDNLFRSIAVNRETTMSELWRLSLYQRPSR